MSGDRFPYKHHGRLGPMAKALPILGIVGAVFGALAIAVLVNAAVFIVVPVAIAGSVVLVAQRTIAGAVSGLVVLALAVLAALGLAGNITTEDNGSTSFGLSEGTGRVLAVACCLAIPVGAVAARWDDALPRWMAIVGVACAVVAVLIAALDPDALAQQSEPLTLVAAVLALASLVAMLPLLRADRDDEGGVPPHEPRPNVAAEAPLRSASPPPARKPASSRPPTGRRP